MPSLCQVYEQKKINSPHFCCFQAENRLQCDDRPWRPTEAMSHEPWSSMSNNKKYRWPCFFFIFAIPYSNEALRNITLPTLLSYTSGRAEPGRPGRFHRTEPKSHFSICRSARERKNSFFPLSLSLSSCPSFVLRTIVPSYHHWFCWAHFRPHPKQNIKSIENHLWTQK